MASLYIIATPIGNLEDITLRALRILKEVDVILCEDTRTTKKLLSKYDIHTPTLSYHTHSKSPKVERIINLLEEGKQLALVSDAGTPTISDPGAVLIDQIYKELPNTKINVVPGASAVTAALSVAGVHSSEFLFLGFLPHKKGREKLFSEIAENKRTIVFYESPHRIVKTLTSLKEALDKKRKVVVARELTKIYEEVVRGSIHKILDHFTHSSEKRKGEFVVIVEGL